MQTDRIGRNVACRKRRFSCDVISSQFCKLSYPRPPCWFLFTRSGIGKYNKISSYFLFSPYHNTKLQLSDKNISTYTLWKFWFSLWSRWKFWFLLWSKIQVQACVVVFLYTAPYNRKPSGGAKSWPCGCVPRLANPIFQKVPVMDWFHSDDVSPMSQWFLVHKIDQWYDSSSAKIGYANSRKISKRTLNLSSIEFSSCCLNKNPS